MSDTANDGEKPLVSIIIPSLNQGRFLPDALDSALRQDYRPLEVLVLDGGSSDDSVDILRRYAARWPELRWWSEQDGGVAEAVNKGLTRARGKIAGIHSADDIYLEGAISYSVDVLLENFDMPLVYGDGCHVDESVANVLGVTSYEAFTVEALLLGATFILQDSTFFRLDAARSAGGWRSEIYVADLDMWLRIVLDSSAIKVDRVLSAWRRHAEQRNRATSRIWESYQAMVAGSPQVHALPRRLRRAAGAGRAAFVQNYNPGGQWFLRRQLWRAVATYPPVIRVIRDWNALLPGLGHIRHFIRRIGRTEGTPTPTVSEVLWWTTDARNLDGDSRLGRAVRP